MKRTTVFVIIAALVILLAGYFVFGKKLLSNNKGPFTDSDGDGNSIIDGVTSTISSAPMIEASKSNVWATINWRMSFKKQEISGSTLCSNYDWSAIREQPTAGSDGQIWDTLLDRSLNGARFVIRKFVGYISDGQFYEGDQWVYLMIYDTALFQPSNLIPQTSLFCKKINILSGELKTVKQDTTTSKYK